MAEEDGRGPVRMRRRHPGKDRANSASRDSHEVWAVRHLLIMVATGSGPNISSECEFGSAWLAPKVPSSA